MISPRRWDFVANQIHAEQKKKYMYTHSPSPPPISKGRCLQRRNPTNKECHNIRLVQTIFSSSSYYRPYFLPKPGALAAAGFAAVAMVGKEDVARGGGVVDFVETAVWTPPFSRSFLKKSFREGGESLSLLMPVCRRAERCPAFPPRPVRRRADRRRLLRISHWRFLAQ